MKDLGTYHLKVYLKNGEAWIHTWNTGSRWTGGRGSISPIDAHFIPASWEGEQELVETMIYIYTEGNYSCDCNKALFIADAKQEEQPEYVPCGDTMPLDRLVLVRPDGTEREIYKEPTDE